MLEGTWGRLHEEPDFVQKCALCVFSLCFITAAWNVDVVVGALATPAKDCREG